VAGEIVAGKGTLDPGYGDAAAGRDVLEFIQCAEGGGGLTLIDDQNRESRRAFDEALSHLRALALRADHHPFDLKALRHNQGHGLSRLDPITLIDRVALLQQDDADVGDCHGQRSVNL
jgi:hypothetical protein